MFDVRKQHSCLSPDPDIELVVRLPLLSCHGTPSHVPCKELAVKLPLSAYTSAVMSSTHELHARLTASKSSLMPPEWICSVVSGTNLAIYKLAVTPPVMSADFTFIITISASGRWTINVDHKEISRANCPILAECAVHDHLLSVDLVVEILSLLDRCKLCVGNPDEKFSSLIDKHSGKFLDRSGNNIIMVNSAVLNMQCM